MNADTFKKLVQTYGAKPTNWPAPIRHDMQVFLNENPTLQSELNIDKRLDHFLDNFQVSEPNFALIQNIQSKLSSDSNWSFKAFFTPRIDKVLGLTFALLIGIYTGQYSLSVEQEQAFLEDAFDLTLYETVIDDESAI